MKNISLLMVGNFLSSILKTRSVCEDLSQKFMDLGWHVITTSSKRSAAARLVDMVSTIWKQRERYEVAQIDVYSGRAFFWAEAVCWSLRQLKKPYVLSLHGGNLPKFSSKWPNRVRRLLNSANAVTSPSPFLIEKLNVFRNDLILIPNPLNVKAFPFSLRQSARPNLVWLRAFHSIYNPELAPKVVALLKKDFPEIRLRMGGPDKDQQSLLKMKRLAEELKVSNHIDVCGEISREKIGEFLNQSDIFINTTHMDNTPVSVMEAMACGLCIVSTNVGGIPYLLKDGEEGLLVPSENPEAMADAVGRVLNEDELASKISAAARVAAEKFDWANILPRWQSLIQDVAMKKVNSIEWKTGNVIVNK